MAGKIRLGSVLALVLLLLIPASSHAFNVDLGQSMIDDAIAFAPNEVKEYMEARKRLVQKGMGHGFHAQDTIDPMAAVRVYDLLVERLKDGKADDPNVIISFGTLAFFLSETVSPGVCRTLDPLLPENVLYDGTDVLANPQDTVQVLLEQSKPYHGMCDGENVGQAYNIAVNVIVDFWVSAFSEADLEVGEMLPVGSQVDHSRAAIYTPAELETMRKAKAAREAAQEALDKEMAEMVKQGVVTKEVLQWQQQQEDKKEVNRALTKYNEELNRLEGEVNSLHRQGTMQRHQLDDMRQLNARIREVKSRIRELEDDPEMALERERTGSW